MNGPELLKSWREAQGLSQEKAGALVDVHQNTWCDWERGEKAPRTTTALRLHTLTEGACPVESWSESAEVAESYRRSIGIPATEEIDPNEIAGDAPALGGDAPFGCSCSWETHAGRPPRLVRTCALCSAEDARPSVSP